jgi:hypothetical protein
MIFESPKKYQQKEEEGELLGRTMIASTSSSSSKEETKTNGDGLIHVDLLFAWPDHGLLLALPLKLYPIYF